MKELVVQLVMFAGGQLYDFSWVAWLGITLLLALAAVVLATVARVVIDPVAVEVAMRPGRVARWMGVTALALPLAFVLLAYTIIGAPLAAILGVALLPAGALGFLAACLVYGDRVTRAAGADVPAVVAVLVGLVLVRLLRLVPLVGAPVHSLFAWFGLAATCAVCWDLARSWYRRRLPDEVQFAGEEIIEWHPPEDPGTSERPRRRRPPR